MSTLDTAEPPDRSLRLTAMVLLLAALVWWACETWPAEMPVFLPWDFSWIDFLGIALPVAWYARGLRLTPAAARPHAMRTVAFLLGMTVIYAVTQTQFVYLAQHMFFINRLQQFGMHHLGPFLVALGWPGATIARGMPARLRRMFGARWLQRFMWFVQLPVIAGALFIGLLWLWLQPAVHLPAMISPVLYEVMNLSMVIDGLLFWFLILDPRPKPPARHGYATRLVTVILICFPEMLIGAQLTFTTEFALFLLRPVRTAVPRNRSADGPAPGRPCGLDTLRHVEFGRVPDHREQPTPPGGSAEWRQQPAGHRNWRRAFLLQQLDRALGRERRRRTQPQAMLAMASKPTRSGTASTS